MNFEEQMKVLLSDYLVGAPIENSDAEKERERAEIAARLVTSVGFTLDELASLKSVASRYTAESEVFSRDEQRRLEFVRWLITTGRMEGDTAA